MPSLQVIIADDETSFAQGLSEALAYEPDIKVTATASNGRDAARLAVELLPDAMLMDLDMPVMSGIEAIRQIKREAPGVEIVVMTVFDDNAHLFEALQAGAKGYLLKNASPEEVAQAVRNVTQGQAAIPPALAARVLVEFQRLSGQVCGLSGQVSGLQSLFSLLTRQETEVLRQLSQDKTNRQICEELCLEMVTVKKHVGNILKKLQANDRMHAALIARRNGLETNSQG